MEDLRYPIGPFDPAARVDPSEYGALIDEIERAPAELRAAVSGLTDAQLDTPYRDGGWTVRQVVHHVPDSHMNAYIRMRLALTEERPVIRLYDEKRWAELPDSRLPVEVSLVLLETLHRRWVALLRSLTPQDYERRFVHPELGELDFAWLLRYYAWHGRHHVAHITTLRRLMGWN